MQPSRKHPAKCKQKEMQKMKFTIEKRILTEAV